jgi:pSer/pThr/pTyr-binding forkhead associated (FHA) protein
VNHGDEHCAACGAEIEGATQSFAPVEEVREEAYLLDAAAAGVPALVVRKGPEVGERFYLESPEITIGRDPESDIFLNDVTVSRAHARLSIVGADVTVEDVGSLNGTYVNNVLVDSAVLRSGDTLQIGAFQMVFLGGGGA